jgi:hypothetical protein
MILLYVALWIFVKKANTPARKLSMMGMPVNVEGLRSCGNSPECLEQR